MINLNKLKQRGWQTCQTRFKYPINRSWSESIQTMYGTPSHIQTCIVSLLQLLGLYTVNYRFFTDHTVCVTLQHKRDWKYWFPTFDKYYLPVPGNQKLNLLLRKPYLIILTLDIHVVLSQNIYTCIYVAPYTGMYFSMWMYYLLRK